MAVLRDDVRAAAELRPGEHLALDGDSQWANVIGSYVAMDQGNRALALQKFRKAGLPESSTDRQFGESCLSGQPPAQREAIVQTFETEILAKRDAEPKYYNAGRFAFCGHSEAALRLLKKSVEENFLAYPAMDHDPLLVSIRDRPEFAAIRAEAIRRQNGLPEP